MTDQPQCSDPDCLTRHNKPCSEALCPRCLGDCYDNPCEACDSDGSWRAFFDKRHRPQWTTEPPTEPGEYHVWPKAGAPLRYERFIHDVTKYEILDQALSFDRGDVLFSQISHWMRIPTPEPPK